MGFWIKEEGPCDSIGPSSISVNFTKLKIRQHWSENTPKSVLSLSGFERMNISVKSLPMIALLFMNDGRSGDALLDELNAVNI